MKTQDYAVFTIVMKNDEVLFVKHMEDSRNPLGTYGLPGGKIEPYESPGEAATREVFEETGLSVQLSDLIECGKYSVDIETKRSVEPWNVDLYLCKNFVGTIKKKTEAEEPTWLKINDVLGGKYKMPKMSSGYLSVILDILKKNKDVNNPKSL